MNNPFKQWRNGIGFERDFWDGWLEQRGGRWPEAYQFAIDPNSPLRDNIVAEMTKPIGLLDRLRPRRSYKVLDVGAGPITPIGYRVPGVSVEIVATDPLAPIYDELLAKHGVSPPVRTQFAPAEELSSFFGPSSFDAVHMSNALDHSMDPMRGIEEMLRVVRRGGAVLLSHSRNEAEAEGYSGFHQWNFDLVDDDARFVIWNGANRIDVASSLPVKCTVKNNAQAGSNYIHTVITKLEEFSDIGDAVRRDRRTQAIYHQIFDAFRPG